MTSAELITELQATRPVADGALRDRVRTIAVAEPVQRSSLLPRFPRFSPRRFALVALPAAAVVLLGLAGIAGLLDSGSRPQAFAVGAEAVRTEANLQQTTVTDSVQELAPQLKAGAATASDAATPAPTTGRAQRYSAQLTLSVKDIDALSSATQQVQIDDLQGQVDELSKRETALRERIARLSARLAAPGLDAETRATLEARRDAARSELGRARSAHAQVNAEARYATIQLSLQTRQSSVVPAVPSRFDNALDRAVEILALEAMIVLYALVIVGPLALLTLLAWLGRRGLRRRHDEQLLSQA